MKRVYKLLVTLKNNDLLKTYNNSIDNLEHLKLSLLDGKSEIDDKIIDLVADSKYMEVSQLTSIPIMIQEVIEEINNQILCKSIAISDNIDLAAETEDSVSQSNNVNTNNKDFGNASLEIEKEIKGSKLVSSIEDEAICVSTMNDLRVGVKILHRTLGVGEVVDIEDSLYGGCKMLCVLFNGEIEARKFNLAVDTLRRHFVIDVDKENSEPIYEYKNIVSSVKGLKIGAKLMHTIFGIGEILNIEDNEITNSKILTVKFEKEIEPKRFNCSSEVLKKYFGIDTADVVNIEENNSINKIIEPKNSVINQTVSSSKNRKKGCNLYTSLDYFTFKKPYKIRVFDEETSVKNWSQAAQVLFKYLYNKDSAAFMNLREVKNEKGFANKRHKLRRPIEISENLYFEGNKSASDCLKMMSSVSEQFLDVLVKDVRKNVELFIQE